MSEIHHNSNMYEGIEYNEKEDVCIAAGVFKRIKINDDTTITFTNHYKGNLELTKAIGEDNQYSDAENKEYTITIQPADSDKLKLGSTDSHGLNGKTFSYTIKDAQGQSVGGEKTATLDGNGAFEITLKPGETAHFTGMPAIQWKATENAEINAVENFSLDITYSDENNDVLNEKTHWNGYNDNDIIGGTWNNDGIASVDNAVRDNASDPTVIANTVALIKVTNTYSKEWKMVKISSSTSDSGQKLYLGGAKFTAIEQETQKEYTGESAETTGLITWNDGQQDIGTMLPNGTYTIKETKAPDAYTLEGDNWTLTVEDGVPIIKINGNDVESNKEGAVDIFYLENEALYDLPSAGGPGIFLYMIGGTLLLIAGSLMIYINRRREVLKR